MWTLPSQLLIVIACSCFTLMPPSVRMMEELVFSDVVFRGKVVASTGWHGQATFTVSQSWKGHVQKQITVYNYYECDGRFDIGEEYVVFMRYQVERGFTVAGTCGGFTRHIQSAGYALSWLESGSLLTKSLLFLTKRRAWALVGLFIVGLVGFVWLKFFRVVV